MYVFSILGHINMFPRVWGDKITVKYGGLKHWQFEHDTFYI